MERQAHSPASGRPRVALVTLGAADLYAIPQIVAHLLRRASEHVDFVVISQVLAEDLHDRVEWRRIPMFGSIPFRLRFPLFVFLASVALRRARVDLKHVFGAHPLVVERVDLATVQFSHVVHYEIAPDQDNRLLRSLVTSFERWCYRRARALAAPSQATKRELERHFPGARVVVVPNGVDTDRFRPDGRARATLRSQEGVGADDVVAVFVGRAWYGKGIDIALRAVADARAGGAHVRIWVVGDESEEAAALAQDLGLGDAARFFGRRADVERFLQGSDVFLFPSLTETFGLACFEAAASGLPIIATRVGGIEELLAGGEAGLVADRTPAAFAEALGRLARDPELRDRMGSAARERALGFGWDRAAQALVDVYRELLEAPQGSHV